MELCDGVADTAHLTDDAFLHRLSAHKHRTHVLRQHPRLHHQLLQTWLRDLTVLTDKARDAVLNLLKVIEGLLYPDHHTA